MDIKHKTEYVPIDSLKQHPENPRQINKGQLETLKESIQNNPEFFEARPVLYNKDRVIFAGNMRYLAAKELGLSEIPAILLDVPKEKERELMIIDNHQNGEWNLDTLANTYELEELEGWGLDSKDLKFSSKDESEDLGYKITCPHCQKDIKVSNRVKTVEAL